MSEITEKIILDNNENWDSKINTQSSESKIQIDNISWNLYVASSIERKRSLMMYYLFGIMMSLDKKDLSEFESFHVRQSMWWWMIAIIWILLSVVLTFIPYSWSFVVPIRLILLIFFGIYNFQAINWQYKKPDQAKWNLFYWLGAWLMLIFEM